MWDDRTRGVTLTTLDLTPVLSRAQGEAGPDAEVSVGFDPYAVAEVNGVTYVVCNEGVGWRVTDDEPLTLDIYVSSPGHIAILPRYAVTLSREEVLNLATGDEVDLADHIRSFGARLEGNFWTWHRTLTEEV